MTWLVTTGEYSNYRVLCACPDEATAKVVADAIRHAWVEEVPLRTEPPVVEKVLHVNWVLGPDGVENPYPYARNNSEGWTSREFWWGEPKFLRCESTLRLQHSGNLLLHLVGWDHTRVRKVFSEQRARILAEQDIFRAREPGQLW